MSFIITVRGGIFCCTRVYIYKHILEIVALNSYPSLQSILDPQIRDHCHESSWIFVFFYVQEIQYCKH